MPSPNPKPKIYRKTGEANEKILCACGCGTVLWKFDVNGRLRSFVTGHNARKVVHG